MPKITVRLLSGVRDVNFDLNLRLLPYFVYASSIEILWQKRLIPVLA